VFTTEPRVLSSVVASQARIHATYGGVVPEIASRAHLQQILPVVRQALAEANVDLGELAGIAVAYTPGLVGSILIGLTAAKALALALDVPLLGVNHLVAHLYACQMNATGNVFPCVGMVVSGGHSNLFYCREADDLELIGATIDDAAGEAFDKVASLLRLGYPGGPAIEKAAKAGDPKAFDFPRTFLREERLDFSFSGLKTAVRYALFGQDAQALDKELTAKQVADAAASFQQAVVDVLVGKCRQAVRRYGVSRLCVGGGVAANSALRTALAEMAEVERLELVIPPLAWCTDNAAMAAVAVERYRRGEFDPLDLDAVPGLVRRA
jgi:N6-L-threonylcarbamoyladenine synthase